MVERRWDSASSEQGRLSNGQPESTLRRQFGRALWEVVQEELTERGLSLSIWALGRMTGISPPTLAKWRDQAPGSLMFYFNERQLQRLCSCFDWEPDALRLLWSEETDAERQCLRYIVEEKAKIEGLREVDPDGWHRMTEVIEDRRNLRRMTAWGVRVQSEILRKYG